MLGRGGGSSKGKRQRKLIQRQSPELVAFLLLEYLVLRRQNREKACSSYHLATKVGLKTQRLERIQDILQLLRENQLVSAIEVENATYFEATERGTEFYLKNARPVFGVFVKLYDRPQITP